MAELAADHRPDLRPPVLAKTLAGYPRYLAAAQDTLMAGRSASGSAQRQVRAVLGHALAFHTWHSLAIDQGLEDREIVPLMLRLVSAAEENLNRSGRTGLRDTERIPLADADFRGKPGLR